MIDTYLKYQCVLLHLSMIDTNYRTCPSKDEWNKARFLEPLYDIITLFSGSHYTTANLYFHRVWRIQLLILKELEIEDQVIQAMARVTKDLDNLCISQPTANIGDE